MVSEDLLKRITISPEICHGKPCIRGLRYPVEMILELLSAGMTHEEILTDYDDLEPDDIRAALLYAARLSQVRITNAALEALFLSHLADFEVLFQQHQVIELSRTAIIVHI